MGKTAKENSLTSQTGAAFATKQFVDYKCRNVCYKFSCVFRMGTWECWQWVGSRGQVAGSWGISLKPKRANETQPQLSRKQVAQLLMLHIFRAFYYILLCLVFVLGIFGWFCDVKWVPKLASRVVSLRLNLNEHQTVRHKPVDATRRTAAARCKRKVKSVAFFLVCLARLRVALLGLDPQFRPA